MSADTRPRPVASSLNLLKPRLVQSDATVIVPFDQRVIFICLLNCAEFSSRFTEVSQPLDAISWIQLHAGGRRLSQRGLPGTV